jgi:hypothetical protein
MPSNTASERKTIFPQKLIFSPERTGGAQAFPTSGRKKIRAQYYCAIRWMTKVLLFVFPLGYLAISHSQALR